MGYHAIGLIAEQLFECPKSCEVALQVSHRSLRGARRARVVLISLMLVLAIAIGAIGTRAGHFPQQAIKSQWTAQWIWATPDGLEPNSHVFFRRNFSLKTVPKGPVVVDVSAETEYTLYVNGQKVGFGPPISDSRYHYFDTRDIQSYLRAGANVIAAHVYSLATATEDTAKERGLFILEGSVPQAGTSIVLDTNRNWKFLIPEMWDPASPRQSWVLHYVEIVDLRKEPVGWMKNGFDDSKWKPALEQGSPPKVGYQDMIARDLGEIDEEYAPVSGVVRRGEVRRETAMKIPALAVNAEKFLPIQTVKFSASQSVSGPHPLATMETPVEGNDAAIVLDMGKIVLGCPYIDVEGAAGTRIDVSLSEYLRDGRVFASRLGTATERSNLTDRITLRDGRQDWQRQDYSGYRFIQLTVRGAIKPVIVHRVGTVLHKYRFTHEAEFRSSDPTLDRIFELAKWSHRVDTHWGYCGSGWREHAQWSDLVWPALSESVFNDAGAMRYYLRQITLSQDEQGRMKVPYPGRVNIEMPEQSMWFARMLWDSGLYFGDTELLRDLLPTMVKENEWFKKHLSPRGLITTAGEWKNMWCLIDWGYPLTSLTDRGELATLNLVYYSYLRSVERTATEVGDAQVSESFGKQADLLRETINHAFLASDDARYCDKPGHQSPSQFASTLAVEYGVAPAEVRDKVFDFAVGPELRPGKASPWFMYEALEAFAQAGRYEDAIAAIHRYWGTFLDAGATTLWEMWNIPGENVIPLPGIPPEVTAQSITYAGGPAPYVVNHVLGVQPMKLGFGQTLIAPHFSGLKFAEASAPTPKGAVRVGWRQNEKENVTVLFLEIPEGMNATFQLPYSKIQAYVRLNDQLLFDGKQFNPNPAISNPQVREGYLELPIAQGSYYFESNPSRPVEGPAAGTGQSATKEPIPSVDQILDKYATAIGGKAAFDKLTSRVSTGSLQLDQIPVSGPETIYEKPPNKQMRMTEMASIGTYRYGFNGSIGWQDTPQTGVAEAPSNQLAVMRRSSDFTHGIRLKEYYSKLAVKSKDSVNGHDAYVIEATTAEGSADLIYFDVETGLLVRSRLGIETPSGAGIVDTSYSDYREVDGIKLPFIIHQSRPEYSYVIRLTEVKHNVPIDDAKFDKPASH